MRYPAVRSPLIFIALLLLVATLSALALAWVTSQVEGEHDDSQIYTADTYSVPVPRGFSVHTYPFEGQQIIVFEDQKATLAFQVFQVSYDGSLSLDVLREELPQLVIENVVETQVDGAFALSFHGDRPDFGETFEVWFVRNNLLYQVVTYGSLDVWLLETLKTWRFR